MKNVLFFLKSLQPDTFKDFQIAHIAFNFFKSKIPQQQQWLQNINIHLQQDENL